MSGDLWRSHKQQDAALAVVAGAATPDIISQYVGCIKALREVDPAGILLNAVGGPIKAYLRSRRDTIRCILASLTDDHDAGEATHSESLFEELQQPPQPEVRFAIQALKASQASHACQKSPASVPIADAQPRHKALVGDHQILPVASFCAR